MLAQTMSSFRRIPASAGVFALLLAGPAFAHPDHDDEGLPVLSLEHDLVLDPDSLAVPAPPPQHAMPHTIFANFDGATLTRGGHSSHNNTTGLSSCTGEYPAFGDGAKRDAVYQASIHDWRHFAVTVTDQRPTSGNYTMVMVGPNRNCCGALGVAPVICGTSNLNAVAFVCAGSSSSMGAGALAAAVSQEAAHTYGLMHVNDSGEIMNPSVGPSSDPDFKDACYSYNPSYCGAQRTFCGNGQQNSIRELTSFFGEAVPDTEPPTAVVTYPNDGDRFEPGSTFDITADASDDVGVRDVRLFVNGMAFHPITQPPYGWGVSNIPEGTYDIWVVATDYAMNSTQSDTVTITVALNGTPDGDDSDSSDDGEDSGDGSGGASSGSGNESGSGGLPPGAGGDDDDAGCACRATPSSGAWLLLPILAFTRRRRPR